MLGFEKLHAKVTIAVYRTARGSAASHACDALFPSRPRYIRMSRKYRCCTALRYLEAHLCTLVVENGSVRWYIVLGLLIAMGSALPVVVVSCPFISFGTSPYLAAPFQK